MRGKVFQSRENVLDVGITPAYAGKSFQCRGHKQHRRDHPRLCGEKPADLRVFRTVVGSPPPMRGKVIAVCILCRLIRITPAYAGKRWFLLLSCCHHWDHPRLCGEKTGSENRDNCCVGSPPPMRGKANRNRKPWERSRITPAYAGKR